MKQQDIAAVIIIVFMAAVLSFVLSGKFITSGAKDRTAEVVSPIQAEFQLPDSKVFNSDAVNPTVRIEIAPGTNPQPFINQNQ